MGSRHSHYRVWNSPKCYNRYISSRQHVVATDYIKELQMKATTQQQLNKLLASITALHNASKDYKAELDKFKPLYDSATPDEQKVIRNAVAQLVGKLYAVKPIMLKTGTLGFERTSPASKALRRVLPVDKLSTKPSKTTRKSVDPVQVLANKFAKLSKVEQRRFLTQIAK